MTVTDPISIDEYFAGFVGPAAKETKASAALDKALDIRKFEIELYWKRAGYFWTFIAAAFTGYFLVFNSLKDPTSDVLFAINCLGLVFSVGWYLANRGSKYWQLNWERHVDLLEEPVTGPLYKTVIDPDGFSFDDLVGPYAFSVSKINTILSLFVVFIWVFLGLRSLSSAFKWIAPTPGTNLILLSIATFVCVFLLMDLGVSRETESHEDCDRYKFRRRRAPQAPRVSRYPKRRKTRSETPRAET